MCVWLYLCVYECVVVFVCISVCGCMCMGMCVWLYLCVMCLKEELFTGMCLCTVKAGADVISHSYPW